MDTLDNLRHHLNSACEILDGAVKLSASLRKRDEIIEAARKVVRIRRDPKKEWDDLKEAIGELEGLVGS